MVALEMRRPPALQHRRPKKSCGGKAAPNAQILPQTMPESQEDCPNENTRCVSGGCWYFREVTTKKGGISRICQFHGHKVAAADLVCEFFPGQSWVYGGNDA